MIQEETIKGLKMIEKVMEDKIGRDAMKAFSVHKVIETAISALEGNKEYKTKMSEPCNLYVPSGGTPMAIADAILRECDNETLADVLYFIECYVKRYNSNLVCEDHDKEEGAD